MFFLMSLLRHFFVTTDPDFYFFEKNIRQMPDIEFIFNMHLNDL